jgi:hypothetical protein
MPRLKKLDSKNRRKKIKISKNKQNLNYKSKNKR